MREDKSPSASSGSPEWCGLSDDRLWQMASEASLHGEYERELIYLDEFELRGGVRVEVWLARIRCLYRLGRKEEVIEVAARFRKMAAGNPAVLDSLGEVLQSLYEFELALEVFRDLRHFERMEVRVVGLAREVVLLMRMGRMGDAESVLDRALRLGPWIPEVRFAEALVLRLRDPLRAKEILRDLVRPGQGLPWPFVVNCGYVLAGICDRLKEEEEAMVVLKRAKEEEVRSNPLVGRLRRQRHAWREWHGRGFVPTADECERWHRGAERRPEHAVMLGHPRSGTTLMEQILDAHPGLVSVEESDVHSRVMDSVWVRRYESEGSGESFGEWLRKRGEIEWKEGRDRYFLQMEREAGKSLDGMVLLDKNPGLSSSLMRLPRSLPGARLLVVLRDPRDVCLSAYFQSIQRTPWSVHWLSLEETVEQYVFVMGLWLSLRERLAQPWMETRYEDLVADPCGEGRRVTEFLGLSWDRAQEEPAKHVAGKRVRSPSSEDVREGVHGRAVGRWRRYEKWLVGLESSLAPFLESFGYRD